MQVYTLANTYLHTHRYVHTHQHIPTRTHAHALRVTQRRGTERQVGPNKMQRKVKAVPAMFLWDKLCFQEFPRIVLDVSTYVSHKRISDLAGPNHSV